MQLYWDKDCVEVFCKHIKKKAKRLYHMFPEMPMKRLTQEEWREFNPIRTGGIFHQARGFLPITLEIIKVYSRNLVTFPKI